MLASHLVVLSSQLPLVVPKYAPMSHEHQSSVVVHVAIYFDKLKIKTIAIKSNCISFVHCCVWLTSLSRQLSLHPLCTEIEYDDWIYLDCVSFAFVDETFATIVYSFRFFC